MRIKKLIAFDLDDCLIFSDAKIKLYDNHDKLVKELSPSQFNFFVNEHDHYMCFNDFKCESILSNSIINKKIFSKLLKYRENNIDVAIVTARMSRKLVLNFFRSKGGNLKPIMVHAVFAPKYSYHGSIPERKTQAIQFLVNKNSYNFVKMYDDNIDNLKAISQLNSEKLTVKTKHVKHDS